MVRASHELTSKLVIDDLGQNFQGGGVSKFSVSPWNTLFFGTDQSQEQNEITRPYFPRLFKNGCRMQSDGLVMCQGGQVAMLTKKVGKMQFFKVYCIAEQNGFRIGLWNVSHCILHLKIYKTAKFLDNQTRHYILQTTCPKLRDSQKTQSLTMSFFAQIPGKTHEITITMCYTWQKKSTKR